jgi:toxin YoeB
MGPSGIDKRTGDCFTEGHGIDRDGAVGRVGGASGNCTSSAVAVQCQATSGRAQALGSRWGGGFAGRGLGLALGYEMSSQEHLLVFDWDFLEDLAFWVSTNRKVALKVLELVEAIRRDPFDGLGKPEPLRHLGQGVWSRRITQEHRLVYKVADDRLLFAQARYHY